VEKLFELLATYLSIFVGALSVDQLIGLQTLKSFSAVFTDNLKLTEVKFWACLCSFGQVASFAERRRGTLVADALHALVDCAVWDRLACVELLVDLHGGRGVAGCGCPVPRHNSTLVR
jgi:hypothetical protein